MQWLGCGMEDWVIRVQYLAETRDLCLLCKWPDWLLAPPILLLIGYQGLFPWGWSSCDTELTPDLLPVSRLRMSGSLPPLTHMHKCPKSSLKVLWLKFCLQIFSHLLYMPYPSLSFTVNHCYNVWWRATPKFAVSVAFPLLCHQHALLRYPHLSFI